MLRRHLAERYFTTAFFPHHSFHFYLKKLITYTHWHIKPTCHFTYTDSSIKKKERRDICNQLFHEFLADYFYILGEIVVCFSKREHMKKPICVSLW